MAPRRFEIEPSRIADILSETFILERLGPRSFRYRLAGTRVCDRLGAEFRGADFFSCWSEADRPLIERDLLLVAEKGAVLVLDVETRNARDQRAVFEFIILPLVHTNQVIDRFLGAVSTTSRADWLGSAPLTSLKLIKTELHWPEKGINPCKEPLESEPSFLPLSATGQSDQLASEQSVFLPHVRTARIVRQDRRSFRVYEGGLSEKYCDDRGKGSRSKDES